MDTLCCVLYVCEYLAVMYIVAVVEDHVVMMKLRMIKADCK